MAAAFGLTCTWSVSFTSPLSRASSTSIAVISLVMDATSRLSSAFFSKITAPVAVSARMAAGDVSVIG